ncbi:MAG: hypothetical protein ACP5O1_10890 [Phycisphaerae bacterium]
MSRVAVATALVPLLAGAPAAVGRSASTIAAAKREARAALEAGVGPTAGRIQGFVKSIRIHLSKGLSLNDYLKCPSPRGVPQPFFPAAVWESENRIAACTAKHIFQWTLAHGVERPVPKLVSGRPSAGTNLGLARVAGAVVVVRAQRAGSVRSARVEIDALHPAKPGRRALLFRFPLSRFAHTVAPAIVGGGSGDWVLATSWPAEWGGKITAYRMDGRTQSVTLGIAHEPRISAFAAEGGAGFGGITGGHWVHLAVLRRHRWLHRRIHLFGPPMVYGAMAPSARRVALIGFGPPTMIGSGISVIQAAVRRPGSEKVLRIWGVGEGRQAPACAPVYSGNGRWLAVATFHSGRTSGAQVLIISTKTFRVCGAVGLSDEAPISLAFSPHSARLAIECWYRLLVVGLPPQSSAGSSQAFRNLGLNPAWQQPVTIPLHRRSRRKPNAQ